MIERKCGSCDFYQRQPLAKLQGACRYNPPSAQFVPAAGPITGQMQMQLLGVFPPVGENDWCGKWQSGAGDYDKAN